jgi:hypothetical protein
MKRLLTLSAVASLLVMMLSLSYAASNLNLSKSNINRLVYPTGLVSEAQANAILAELDKAGGTVGAGQVTEIIKRHGVQTDRVKKIVILPADKPGKQITVILLTNPAEETQAREIAVSDSGLVSPKPVPKPIKK